MRDYTTIKDIANRTGLSDKTVRRLLKRGCIPHCWSGEKPGQGKILVRWSDWEASMDRRIGEIQQDEEVMSILEEMSTATARTD